MPEGDTIHAIAQVLGRELDGQRLELLEVRQQLVDWGPSATVQACRATGKHLVVSLVTADGPRFLRVHLGMKGSWHRYRPGERWRRSPSRRRLVIATDSWVFVCFDAREVEIGFGATARVKRLGPDLLATDRPFDVTQVIENARRRDAPLGELLLDQRVASGLGNVYKCEALFLEGLDPWRLASTLADDALGELYRRTEGLMRENLARGGLRTTTERGATGRFWVYRRARRPCRRCQTPIESRLQGAQARMTYWCPSCQR